MRVCVWCPVPHPYGEVAPLADRTETHGLCPAAAARETARLDAPLFFTPHVAEMCPPLDGAVTIHPMRETDMRTLVPSVCSGEARRLKVAGLPSRLVVKNGSHERTEVLWVNDAAWKSAGSLF